MRSLIERGAMGIALCCALLVAVLLGDSLARGDEIPSHSFNAPHPEATSHDHGAELGLDRTPSGRAWEEGSPDRPRTGWVPDSGAWVRMPHFGALPAEIEHPAARGCRQEQDGFKRDPRQLGAPPRAPPT